MVRAVATDYFGFGGGEMSRVKNVIDPKRQWQRTCWPVPSRMRVCVFMHGGIRVDKPQFYETFRCVKRRQAIKVTNDNGRSLRIDNLGERLVVPKASGRSSHSICQSPQILVLAGMRTPRSSSSRETFQRRRRQTSVTKAPTNAPRSRRSNAECVTSDSRSYDVEMHQFVTHRTTQ